ncbi:response regulator [Sphingobium naphthae]|jgi:DNA-binding NarL/FixJ family response regulator|uniref:Response regulator transcription factor n=1 Tax=Sphingobium naphthae TaxID=1886786 RepID=A0ABU3ZY85_9SPHN|nr:response regulator transcription factor [Sphingobium naphthae]MCC4250872.1 response regulator transcription factor [Sphingobium naphthae]MDV5824483.1 response regulator transcription factor [Sphingobium naphthae]MEC8036478.1 response regulator transcription factor [Pseudomonadota bacterium]PDH66398.1 MAG: DNA-binding response regulator [Sphingomonadaceae bacterium MED-G03]|tara:strand:- start:4232 stop:4882 length:651 start_codon:yes stop_codon:yes gene_type:complete
MSSPVRRIVLADDHEAIRLGVRSVLSTHPDWRVVGEASNGRDALELIREVRPDIAILDYSLPMMNGLELTRAIKKELPRTEILIFTMHDREDVLAELLKAGVRGYLLKSDASKHLVAAVEALSIRRPYFSGNVSQTLLDRFIEMAARDAAATALTPREREIVQLIAEGRLNKEIAAILGLSIKTVETHRAAAMHKLDLNSTADLVRYAVRNNIIEA